MRSALAGGLGCGGGLTVLVSTPNGGGHPRSFSRKAVGLKIHQESGIVRGGGDAGRGKWVFLQLLNYN